ncbi:DUF3667 domain-containing protein [Chromobacterium alticapitis]|uniref:DUF3667 domain-containing protein n=1 Tax=Chromobacterium alticapitis TaxID=2073169 RepID=A0A2S5DH82_9NEIS|nr:DUF3667 domain-containing protein [Chromobacterium alticapitis]POZ62446.1 hypothetical protein C2I19_08085 [Chromobacterium alticapitis]
MSRHRPSPSPEQCANCGHAVGGRFCPDCGQKTHIEIPSLWEFIHEYLHHYVSLEGALTRSLWLLVARPGHLTAEYLRGRRQRYVKPFQLYLSISFIFFVLLGLAGPRLDDGGQTHALDIQLNAASTQEKGAVESKLIDIRSHSGVVELAGASGQLEPLLKPWLQHVQRTVNRFQHDPGEVAEELLHTMRGRAPYVLFGLMPLFALLLLLAYIGRHRVYGVHLVFTLHFHAWLFLALCLGFALPKVSAWLFFAGTPVYLWLAQRRVYGGGGWSAALRTLGLLGVYTLLVCLGMVVLLLVSL